SLSISPPTLSLSISPCSIISHHDPISLSLSLLHFSHSDTANCQSRFVTACFIIPLLPFRFFPVSMDPTIPLQSYLWVCFGVTAIMTWVVP
ncbi:unnamed protein product, partial [Brassica rapa subsp. trilocularis]